MNCLIIRRSSIFFKHTDHLYFSSVRNYVILIFYLELYLKCVERIVFISFFGTASVGRTDVGRRMDKVFPLALLSKWLEEG